MRFTGRRRRAQNFSNLRSKLKTERLERRWLLANTAPVLDRIADQAAIIGNELALTFTGSDADEDAIGFLLDPDETPAGATVNRQTGAFRWTPSEAGTFRFVAMLIDNGNRPRMDAQAFRITVTPPVQNQAPINTAPATATTNEDTPLLFTGDNAVSVADPDAGAAEIEVGLSASNGRVSLGSTTGLTFLTGTGTNDLVTTFRGTLAAINTALAGLSFTPTGDFNGTATVSITSNDLGNTGVGGAKSDTDQIEITVNAVNDAPTFIRGSSLTLAEDSPAQTIETFATNISPGPGNESSQAVSFLVSADHTELFSEQPAIAANGTLTFTPAANAHGTAVVSVRAKDDGGVANNGVDTSAVQTFQITLTSVNDSPQLAPLTDRTGNVNGPLGFVITGQDVDGDLLQYEVFVDHQPEGGNGDTATIDLDTGEFHFTPTVAGEYGFLIGVIDSGDPPLADTELLVINVSASDAPLTAPAFQLSAGSNIVTGQTTDAAKVTLVGQTSPLVTVALLETGAITIANQDGRFFFVDVPLVSGHNTLTVRATQAANSVDYQRVVQRVAGMIADPVLAWNQEMLTAIKNAALAPPAASRIMAITSAAVMDAVNNVEGTAPRFVSALAPAGANVQAAVIGAAHRALSSLIPSQQAAFDALRTSQLASLPSNQSVTDGLAVGLDTANGMLAIRANDGSANVVAYTPGTDPGDWQPTPPAFAPALLPQWATLTPFTMTSSSQFQPPAPPALDSAAWAVAFNEVKELGSATSATRTADQTQIARYWADNAGVSYTPPGHWNEIAVDLAQDAAFSISTNARLFGELNLALADAAIVAWNAKYAYNTWRPITAIRNADSANNPAVTADAAWEPLLTTPPFPEYTSGHSTFSAAAGTILAAHFGANTAFSSTSSSLLENGVPVTRSFANFDAAVDEAGKSRIYGGIHFEFANAEGKASGHALGDFVLENFNIGADTQGPSIFITSPAPGTTTDQNITVVGHVLDNLSGVDSLTVRVDGGVAQSLAVGATGSFSFTSALALDGTADGPHTLTFQATDALGNLATRTFNFTLAAAPSAAAFARQAADGGAAAAVDQALADLSWLSVSAAAQSLFAPNVETSALKK